MQGFLSCNWGFIIFLDVGNDNRLGDKFNDGVEPRFE